MNNFTKKGALLVAGLGGAFGLFAWLERNPPPPNKPVSRRRSWSREEEDHTAAPR